ncbi:MAG: PQQ-dependent sugar dehydrogenase, partial [Burkholderiaceae bacterium]
ESAQRIFAQHPAHRGNNHWGARIVFAPDGNLFVTLGDRYDLREQALDLSTHIGKIVRLRPDGGVPGDNPFVTRSGALPEIWSYGHRNVQGAALHPGTGGLWIHEHGPRGGDEVNLIRPGRNYGWPRITFGREYASGFRIGEGTSAPDVEPPLWQWTPSIAPSGLSFVTGSQWGDWEGDILAGSLAGERLIRLAGDGEALQEAERLLHEIRARIRDVRQGPDGAIYLLDESKGRLLRLRPPGDSG